MITKIRNLAHYFAQTTLSNPTYLLVGEVELLELCRLATPILTVVPAPDAPDIGGDPFYRTYQIQMKVMGMEIVEVKRPSFLAVV